MTPVNMTACKTCGVYRDISDYEDYTDSGIVFTHDECSGCREPGKVIPLLFSVDCFGCGATLAFKEGDLQVVYSNYGNCRIMRHSTDHLIVYKDRFVAGCCWPITEHVKIMQTMRELVNTRPIRTD